MCSCVRHSMWSLSIRKLPGKRFLPWLAWQLQKSSARKWPEPDRLFGNTIQTTFLHDELVPFGVILIILTESFVCSYCPYKMHREYMQLHQNWDIIFEKPCSS